MIASCSPWIVATMSRIWPVRARPELGEQRVGDAAGARERVGIVEVLVEDVLELDARRTRTAGAGGGRRGRRASRGRTAWRPRRASRRPPARPRSSSTWRRPMYQRSPASSSIRPKHSAPASSSRDASRRCSCHFTASASASFAASTASSAIAARGPAPHRFEAVLREPQTGAFGRHVRVGHAAKRYNAARFPAPERNFGARSLLPRPWLHTV